MIQTKILMLISYVQIIWNPFWYFIECTLREGSYIHKPPKSKTHFVEISKPFEDSYQWKNGSYEKWSLTPIVGERNALKVGKECPHYDSGYKIAKFNEAGIYGPSDDFYSYNGMLRFIQSFESLVE